MIIIKTAFVTTKDEQTAVHAVRFSDPVLNATARRWTARPAGPADSQDCAPVLFLAPAGLVDTEHDEPMDRRPSRRAPIDHTRRTRRPTRTTM